MTWGKSRLCCGGSVTRTVSLAGRGSMSITRPMNCVNTGRSSTGWDTSAAFAHIRLHPVAPKMPTNRTMRPVLIPCGNRNDSAAMARDADIHAIHAKGPESENQAAMPVPRPTGIHKGILSRSLRSEEHTSELQSLMRTSYAVFCLKKKKKKIQKTTYDEREKTKKKKKVKTDR